MMRVRTSAGVVAGGILLVAAVSSGPLACGGSDVKSDFGSSGATGASGTSGSSGFDQQPCQGLACKRAACMDRPPTSLTGVVFDPAGKVPLYDVAVYIPDGAVPPIAEGASCNKCAAHGPILASALTDTFGKFTIDNVPAGTEFPLVIEVGKWRRTVTVAPLTACSSTPLDKELTRLPRNRAEGSIPRIALVTGAADPLECLLRKIGIEDGEFGTGGGAARVQMFGGYGYEDPPGTQHRATDRFASGGVFGDAMTFYSDAAQLAAYDIALFACEGYYNPDKKPNRQALVDFTSKGGRVFASHWHRYWFHDDTQPSPFPDVATWTDRAPPADPPTAPVDGTVDISFPKGAAMRDWLVNVGASTTPGKLPIREAKHNVDAVDLTRAQSWITLANPFENDKTAVEYLSFNTPVGAAADAQCGRIVYSGLHVSSGDATGAPFPTGCTTTDLSPQEKALEFMLFDLSACVQADSSMPQAPR
jgi:hypothetical protein